MLQELRCCRSCETYRRSHDHVSSIDALFLCTSRQQVRGSLRLIFQLQYVVNKVSLLDAVRCIGTLTRFGASMQLHVEGRNPTLRMSL